MVSSTTILFLLAAALATFEVHADVSLQLAPPRLEVRVQQHSPPPAIDDDKSPVDVQAILNAIGTGAGRCVGRCVNGLLPHMKSVFGLHNIYQQIEPLCVAYNTTKKCIATNRCQHSEVYALVSSGIQSICFQKKTQFIHDHEQCLKDHLDNNSQVCEDQCHFIESLGNFSRKPNLRNGQGIQALLSMLSGLGGVCTSVQCYFPCFRDRMNANCDKSGGVITDALIHPFYRLARIIEGITPGIQKMIAEKVPKSCEFLLRKSSLDALRQKDDETRQQQQPKSSEEPKLLE